jgi:hypothetical protein
MGLSAGPERIRTRCLDAASTKAAQKSAEKIKAQLH